jgi:hypothetical protein
MAWSPSRHDHHIERVVAKWPLDLVAKVAEERPSTRRRIDPQEPASNEGNVRLQPDKTPGIDYQHVSWDTPEGVDRDTDGEKAEEPLRGVGKIAQQEARAVPGVDAQQPATMLGATGLYFRIDDQNVASGV